MAYKNLNHFISTLEKHGELLRINTSVNPELEITEIADRISKLPDGGKALLFENTGTQFPLLINSLGSEKRICMALGMSNLGQVSERIHQLLTRFSTPKQNIWEKIKILPSLKEISSWMPVLRRGNGDCQQVIDRSPDLSKLPVLKCWPNDGGRFVTLPLVHTVDPQSGIRNVGMYRLQIMSENTTGMHWHRHKTGARHYEEYKKLGVRMPVSVVLGGDPVYTYAATAPLPDNVDEYIFAGFLRKQKVELVKCISNDIYVPSDADIVMEGYVDPNEALVWEGPFGDHTGFYSLADWYPVFHVTCITHRNNAVYPATIVGIPPQEDVYIAKATERIFLAPIRLAMAPEIIDMNLPMEGVAHNLAIIKIKKTFPGQAFKVMNALWGAGQMMFNKVLVVCDEHTDIFCHTSVLDACLKHCTEKQHICLQTGAADVLDHAAQAFTYGGKLCIDATTKLPEEKVLNELVENFSLVTESQIKEMLFEIKVVKNINESFLAKGILIISVENGLNATLDLVRNYLIVNDLYSGIRLVVFYDDGIPLDNTSTLLWLALGNIDPARDISVFEKNDHIQLFINACKKPKGFDGIVREWPEVISSDKSTIEMVDKKWDSYGIGRFVSSPSLQVYSFSGL